jgi:cytochrome c oxidase subunit 2
MTHNQLFLRDLVRIALAIAVLTTIAMLLAPKAEAPRAGPTTVAVGPATAAPPAAARGAKVFESKGCVACHSVDGSARVGPSLLHAFGTEVTLETGEKVAFDDAYIRESVLAPRAKARPGYPPSMPSFDGVIAPRDLDAVVVYLRSLQ